MGLSDGVSGLDPGLGDRSAHAFQMPILRGVHRGDEASRPEGPERELQQALGDDRVGSRDLPGGGGLEPALVQEVDADGPDVEQAGQAVDRSLERVRERELGRGLAHDREEIACSVELALHVPGPLSGAQRLSRAVREGGQRRQLRLRRRRLRREHGLEDAQLLAERERCDQQPVELLQLCGPA